MSQSITPKTSAVICCLKYLALKSVSGHFYHLSNNCQKEPRGKHLRKVWCERSVCGSAASCKNSYLLRSWGIQKHCQNFLYPCRLEVQPWIRFSGFRMVSGGLGQLATACSSFMAGLKMAHNTSHRELECYPGILAKF